MKVCLSFFCAVAFLACTDPAIVNNPSDDAVGVDGVELDGKQADTSPEDSGNSQDTTPDTTVEPDTGPQEGGFGYPCKENNDCNSGFCVPTSEGETCTKTCDSDCPEGWSCKPLGSGSDTTFICLPKFINLCKPCLATVDCTGALGNVALGSRCIEYPGQGWFCGHECSDGSCPSGYSCQDVKDKEGETTGQCVADSGECTCSPYFISLGAETWCAVENDSGLCKGKVKCVEEGLSPCDAPTPEPEVCDGVDNNCDEEVDENTCEDDNTCTSDVCAGEAGCEYTPLVGAACDDGESGTGGDVCGEDGLCGGAPISCELGECVVSSVPNGTDCDVTYAQSGTECDDGSNDTVGDVCDEVGLCAGTLIECPELGQCVSAYTLTEGECVPTYTVDAPCSDGDLNTEGDSCNASGECVGSTIECPELTQCVGAYTLTDGECVPTFLTGEGCSDDDPATVKDACTDSGECVGLPTLCGDGVIEGLETCEDGNTETEVCEYGEKTCTVCDLNCQDLELAGTAYCGDSETQVVFETCDDGNEVDGDGCSSTCTNGSWCGAYIQNIGPTSVFIDENPSGVVPCKGHNPAVSCPPGYTVLEFRSAAANDDLFYDTFMTCARDEPFDAMLCGTSIMNDGQVSSLLLGDNTDGESLTCKGFEPQTGCPPGYDQLVLSTASTNGDSISDNLVTCINKAGMMDGACGVKTANSGLEPSVMVNGSEADALYECAGNVPGLGACPAGYHALRLMMSSYNNDTSADSFTTCIYGGGDCVPTDLDPVEACDGVDNNCDGSIDEGCYTETAGITLNVLPKLGGFSQNQCFTGDQNGGNEVLELQSKPRELQLEMRCRLGVNGPTLKEARFEVFDEAGEIIFETEKIACPVINNAQFNSTVHTVVLPNYGTYTIKTYGDGCNGFAADSLVVDAYLDILN